MSANGISHLSSKAARQIAKLDLAQSKRSATGTIGYRMDNVYDLKLLPLPYGLTDNQTINPLQYGRPWLPYNAGAYRTTYAGYHGEVVTYPDSATATGVNTVGNFTIDSEPSDTTELYVGYIRADYTGDWTFTLSSDDGSFLWIGENAVTGYTSGNTLASASYAGPGTGTVNMIAGCMYPVRLLYGNGPAAGNLNLTYAHVGQTASNDFTNLLYHNRLTNGF